MAKYFPMKRHSNHLPLSQIFSWQDSHVTQFQRDPTVDDVSYYFAYSESHIKQKSYVYHSISITVIIVIVLLVVEAM